MISLFKVNLGLRDRAVVGALAFFQYFTSDKLALKASGAKVVTPEEAPELHDDGRAPLREQAGMPKPKRSRSSRPPPERVRDRPQPQARRRRRDARPLDRLEPAEVEGVLAHELSHIRNRDVHDHDDREFFSMLAALLTRLALFVEHVRRRQPRRDGHAGLADLLVVSIVTYVAQLRPHPLALALPRVRRRPRRRDHHRRARAPDERAAEDLQRHDAGSRSRTSARCEGMNAFFIIPANVEVGRRPSSS